jgi:hypothetical protein
MYLAFEPRWSAGTVFSNRIALYYEISMIRANCSKALYPRHVVAYLREMKIFIVKFTDKQVRSHVA